MSQQNVEAARRSYEAFGQGDIERALEPVDPQIEIYDHDLPDAREYYGLEGLARWQAVWTMHDGKVTRLDYYGSKEQALKAAGLSESDG